MGLRNMFREMDADRNGFISKVELRAAIASKVSRLTGSLLSMLQRHKRAFFIVLMPDSCDAPVIKGFDSGIAEGLLKSADLNGDGVLDFEEFLGATVCNELQIRDRDGPVRLEDK